MRHVQCTYCAQFLFLSFSNVCYGFLRNLQFVYGSGNGNIHDDTTRCRGKLGNGEHLSLEAYSTKNVIIMS